MTITLDLLDRLVTDDLPLTAAIALPRIEEFVSIARTWLEVTLTEWKAPQDEIYTATLVISELYTNSVIHAAGESAATVTAVLDDGVLTVSVSDPDPVVHIPAGGDEEHGRGLEIVQALSRGFGVTPMPGGKIVWTDLLIGGAS